MKSCITCLLIASTALWPPSIPKTAWNQFAQIASRDPATWQQIVKGRSPWGSKQTLTDQALRAMFKAYATKKPN